MKKLFPYLITIMGLYLPVMVNGVDIESGRSGAATCSACHGFLGISANNEWPNLAGQKIGYLVKQIKAFRDGTRVDPVMSGMAAGLSDEDIDNIAAYYNSLK